MGKTNIEYCDEVSNPLFVVDKITGKAGTHCEKPDPEGTCKNCWAEVLNTRGNAENSRFGTGLPYDKSVRDRIEWRRREKEMHRLANLNGRKPESAKFPGNPLVVFTNDTYDLFQPSITDDDRDWVFDNYDQLTDLTLLVQTTYVSLMAKYLNGRYPDGMPPHYIIGMSAGTQKFLMEKYRHLISIRARRRYIIFEPLLGHIDLSLEIGAYEPGNPSPLRASLLDFVHWLIIGGESGPEARSCDASWIRSMLSQSLGRHPRPAILVKQLGSQPYDSDEKWYSPGSIVVPVDSDWQVRKFKDRKGGNQAEMPEDLRIREFPRLQEVHRDREQNDQI